MALIPPFFIDSVVAIGRKRENKTTYTVTGFLYGHLLSDPGTPEPEREYKVFLVTNRHNLQGKNEVQLRFNPKGDEPAREYDAVLNDSNGLPTWYAHDDPKIDIAAFSINANLLKDQGIQFSWF